MTATQLRNSPSGQELGLVSPLSSYGQQSAWAIDATLGSDENPGTPLHPLRTMAEFNRRLCTNYIQQPTTLQLLGDVIDEPMQITGARMKLNASLTVSGTQTRLGGGTISTVTAIGTGGTTYPFQLATTGINWTATPLGSQIVLQGGQVCWIRNVVDANTIVVGAMTTLGSSTVFTPTAGLTFTVNSLSRAQAPLLDIVAQTNGAVATTSITFQNLSLDSASNSVFRGCGVVIQGCELNNPVALSNDGSNTLLYRSCRFTMTSNVNLRGGNGRLNTTACTFVGVTGQPQVVWTSGMDFFTNSLSFYAVNAFVAACAIQVSTGGWHFEQVTTGSILSIQFGGFVFATATGSALNGRNCTGSGVGIDIANGQYVYNGAANKPTLGVASGGTTDVRLGSGGSAITFTYALLGTGKQYAQLDAVPPTTTQIQQGGYARMGQAA
jgi:hypothetical protein